MSMRLDHSGHQRLSFAIDYLGSISTYSFAAPRHGNDGVGFDPDFAGEKWGPGSIEYIGISEDDRLHAPVSATSPTASIPATAQSSSLSDVSPLMPMAPISTP